MDGDDLERQQVADPRPLGAFGRAPVRLSGVEHAGHRAGRGVACVDAEERLAELLVLADRAASLGAASGRRQAASAVDRRPARRRAAGRRRRRWPTRPAPVFMLMNGPWAVSMTPKTTSTSVPPT